MTAFLILMCKDLSMSCEPTVALSRETHLAPETAIRLVRRVNDRAKTALDVKVTIHVRSAESAGVPVSARLDHRNNGRKSQVLFVKGIARSEWPVDLTK